VTFHAKLGNYREKVSRIRDIAAELASGLPSHVDVEAIHEAALLCKCDLTTELVKEFPELQGIVGGLYARAQGKRPATAQAIYDHYRPTSGDDTLPLETEGKVVALADKLDTLREAFREGMIPTGSKDPFALRRSAQGVIRILAEGNFDFLLADLSAGNLALFEFLKDRVRYYFREVRGFPYDEVNATVAATYGDLPDLAARLAALHEVRPTEHFEPLAIAFKRMRNIIRQADFNDIGEVNSALLTEKPERDLYQSFEAVRSELLDDYFDSKNYTAGLLKIASIRPNVDRFFDKDTGVLVNAADPNLRTNRYMLLTNILTAFSTIADFSEIVTAGEKTN
jgi:glycyl-tRNA synthetase beta chain